MIGRTIKIVLLHWLMIATVASDAPAQTPSEGDQKPAGQTIESLPWPVKLGARSQLISQAFPLVDRVVLVPDAATYVDELSKWSPLGRWPVLIEDDFLTPMFVRRFQPAQLIRRVASDHALPAAADDRKKLLDAVVTHAFGGDPNQIGPREVFARQGVVPAGVVITSLDDPAWTAGLALAAGHGQPIAWLDGGFGTPNDELDVESAHRLLRSIEQLVEQQGYSYKAMGDDIDTITICRSIACRTRAMMPAGAHADEPVALTDLIGRNADGTRYAITGWIFSDEKHAAYMAMCSLFLPRERTMLCNTYPAEGGWLAYGMNGVAAAMTQNGYGVTHLTGGNATEAAWLRNLIGGWTTDAVVMNTKGNSDFFDMTPGGGQCYPNDVPILNDPVVLHLIHSWSMQAPQRADCLGGTWLEHGAYAAVGSCWEPFLAAFVPPEELANRWANFVPFLVAARWWDRQGPLSAPWRVVTIGDPLMLFGPPAKLARTRLAPPPVTEGVNLMDQVKTLMRETETDTTGKAYAEAIGILNMLGKDEVACGLWRLAVSKGRQAAAARAALDPLFRQRDVEGFLAAWGDVSVRDSHAVDMLWHLLIPRLRPGNAAADQDALMQLQSSIRQPLPQYDLKRLAPALAAAFGNAHVQEVIAREIKRTTASGPKAALAEMLKQY